MTSNSGLPENTIESLTIDGNGKKWIGTWGGGLVKFDSGKWTGYDTINSGLPDNYVFGIAFDKAGNKWIGTMGGGLAAFGQTVDIQKHGKGNSSKVSHRCYPNPFRRRTTISFELPSKSEVELTVYDHTGKRVATLAEGTLSKGKHTRTFNGKARSAGIYFYELRTEGERSTGKMMLRE